MFKSPGGIAFYIGTYPIHYYGFCIAFGMAFGLLCAYLICKNFYKDLNSDVVFDIAIPVIVGGVIGARLYYCLLSYPYYMHNPFEILQISKGGLSIHGGMIGGLIGGIWYAKSKNLPILKLCDIFTFALLIGQIIGRWGNFFNSEAFGTPCTNFFKLYIPIENRPVEFIQYEYFHPTFLYESLLNIVIFAVLFYMLKTKPKDGKIFFTYLILYSIVRIFIESIRTDSVLNLLNIPFATLISIIIISISILCLRKI